MKINDFLNLLEERQLVSSRVLAQVREKVAKGDRKITSKSLLKYLVKKELITRSQAKQLLETTLTVTAAAESSILGMQALTPEQQLKPQPEEEIPTITPVSPGSAVEDVEHSHELASLSTLEKGGFDSKETDYELKEKDVDRGVRKGRKKKSKGEHEFDTPLLLFGGGGLVVLILAGVIIGYLLSREDADAILDEASGYYDGGSWTQAISQYERFLENHTTHPEISTATVKLGLAKIWKSSANTSQFSQALETAQQVLDSIEDEQEFEIAKRDLASLLPNIAKGLAEQAEQASEPEQIVRFVAESKAALSLCNNTKFLPTSYRDDILLNGILETLDRVERQQQQRKSLAEALVGMQTAIDDGATQQAYEIHRQLIKEHPGLLKDESLATKVREVSAAEQAEVQFVAETQAADTSPRESNLIAEMALAHHRGPAAEAQGIVTVRVGAAMYALDATSGKLLWRKYVGRGPDLPVVQTPSGDLLVVHTQTNELLRLDPQAGQLVWRQRFAGPVTTPVLAGERILVAEKSGKLHVLDARSGERSGYVRFGQKLPVPPSVNQRKGAIYLLGEHSSLFTLSLQDFSCQGVYFVGHQTGSISTPPAVVLDKLAVAENSGRATSRLHLLSTGSGGIVETSETVRRLEGLVHTSLLVAGRRLVAMTSSGEVAVYEVGTSQGSDALTKIATREAESGPPVARFGLLAGGHVWSAGNQLNKLAILATGNRLPVKDIDLDYVGDTFDYPLQISGKTLFHLRHPDQHAGSVVAAMDTETGAALWETQLGVPLSGAASVNAKGPTISAVTASGAAYQIDRQAMRDRVQGNAQRLRNSKTISALSVSVDLGGGRVALGTPGNKTLVHFNPESGGRSLSTISLPSPLACGPIAWDDYFVAPTEVGQVYLYDSNSGAKFGTPFQPVLKANNRFDWQSPAVFGSGEASRLVLTDGTSKLYLLKRTATPEPSLEKEHEAPITGSALNTQLAVAGDSVFAGNQRRTLARYSLPALEAQDDIPLQGGVTWGPYSVGESILLATGAGELVCVDSQGAVLWSQPLQHGPPVGRPLAEGAEVLVSWKQDRIARLSLQDGSELALLEINQPVASGPIAFGKRVLLATADGTLIVVNRP